MLMLAAWILVLPVLLAKSLEWMLRVLAHALARSHCAPQALGVCCPLVF